MKAGAQQGASASGGDLAIMLVLEVYNKAEWEIAGGNDDAEGRARKSESQILLLLGVGYCSLVLQAAPVATTDLDC